MPLRRHSDDPRVDLRFPPLTGAAETSAAAAGRERGFMRHGDDRRCRDRCVTWFEVVESVQNCYIGPSDLPVGRPGPRDVRPIFCSRDCAQPASNDNRGRRSRCGRVGARADLTHMGEDFWAQREYRETISNILAGVLRGPALGHEHQKQKNDGPGDPKMALEASFEAASSPAVSAGVAAERLISATLDPYRLERPGCGAGRIPVETSTAGDLIVNASKGKQS